MLPDERSAGLSLAVARVRRMAERLHGQCLVLARNGPGAMSALSPLSRLKRKLDFGAVRSVFDPKRPFLRADFAAFKTTGELENARS
jgi:hypothetical protein